MSGNIGTKSTQRHYRSYDGVKSLLWASDGGVNGGELFAPGEVVKGSKADLDVQMSQLWTPNALADEGEQDILDVYFDAQAVRANLYGRLYNDTPVETDTQATLSSEVTGTGYAAVDFVRNTDWGAPALDSGDMQTASTTKSFTATASDWTAATYITLNTTATLTAGLLIAYVALASTRTLVDTDQLDVSFNVKLA